MMFHEDFTKIFIKSLSRMKRFFQECFIQILDCILSVKRYFDLPFLIGYKYQKTTANFVCIAKEASDCLEN